MVIMNIYLCNMKTSVWWDNISIYSDFVVMVVFAYLAAIPVCLMVESSTMQLEKQLLPARRHAPTPPKPQDGNSAIN
jgi:hypothetical protein